MKTLTLTTMLCLTASWAQAQEVGQVISRTAVYQQVVVPRQTCTQYQPPAPTQTSGGGAIIGAIAGGLIGSQLGGNNSKGLAAMAGVVGGAMLGDKVESQSPPPGVQTTCTTQNVYENRLTGYNVVYEYAGKQYNVQLPQDPGPTIQLQVTPVGLPRSEAPSPAPAPAAVVMTQLPAPTTTYINESRVVYVPAPVYRYYSPIQTHVNLGWGWHGGHRHGHWR